jgi:hypothetical protein
MPAGKGMTAPAQPRQLPTGWRPPGPSGPRTSSVDTLMKRRTVPALRAASSSTCVPYVLFMVNARLLPKLLSTCVCAAAGHHGVCQAWWTSCIVVACMAGLEARGVLHGCRSCSSSVPTKSVCGSAAAQAASTSPARHAPRCSPGQPGACAHLRRKVHDCVDLLSSQDEGEQVHALDVALDKLRGRGCRTRGGGGCDKCGVRMHASR